MSDQDIDRTLAEWFHADAMAAGPADGVERALEGVLRRRPRPAWLAGPGSHWGWEAQQRELNVGARVFPRVAANAWTVLVVLAVLAALLGAALLAGARLLETSPLPTTRLGSLAYAVDGDIFVADWDGRNPVRIADGLPGGTSGCGSAGYWAEGPMWSPDGRFLAYRSPRRQDQCDRPDADEFPTILLSDPAGNVVAEVPGVGWITPWSPDSTRVATWLDLYPSTRIGVYGIDGARQAVLSLPPSLYGTMFGDYDPFWAPDGESILMVVSAAGEVEPSSALWEVPIDGSPPRRLSANHPGAVWWGSRSPDGTSVAYVEGGRPVVAAADASLEPALPGRRDGDLGPAWWSPTGDRIAFLSDDRKDLRVMNVASEAVTTLVSADEGEQLWFIGFAPEGDRVLFTRPDADTETRSLWRVNTDGSDLQLLVSGADTGDWQSRQDPDRLDTRTPSSSVGLP